MAFPTPQPQTLSQVLAAGDNANGSGIADLGSLSTTDTMDSQVAPPTNGPAITLPLTFYGIGNNVCCDGDYWILFTNHNGQQMKIPAYYVNP